MEAADPGTEGFARYIQWLMAYFYSDDGLLALTQVTRLQRSFNVLGYLFERVGLRTNVSKMVSISCQPCYAIGGDSV